MHKSIHAFLCIRMVVHARQNNEGTTYCNYLRPNIEKGDMSENMDILKIM